MSNILEKQIRQINDSFECLANQLIEPLAMCGGYRCCKNRECDETKEDCQDCIKDKEEAIKDIQQWRM